MEPEDFFKAFFRKFMPEIVNILCIIFMIAMTLMLNVKVKFWIGLALLGLIIGISGRLFEARKK